jgi:hypothetical protein
MFERSERVTAPTGRRYLKELELLGICELTKGSAAANQPDTAVLAAKYSWLRKNLEN